MAGDIVWTQSTLGDIVEEWIVGSTPPRTDTKCFIREGGTPWVRAEDVKNGTLYETAEQISEAGGRRMQLVPANAVLVTTAGTIGRVAVAGRPVFCNQAVQALSFRRDTILPLYGCYFLRSRRPLLLQLANGTTIPNVSKGKLKSVPICFPPVPAQERMIAQMRMPEMLHEKAEELQALLKKYLLALTMHEIRRTKVYKPVGELLAEAPLTGLRAKASPTGNGVPLVNKLSRDGGRLTDLADCRRVLVSEKQLSRYRLRPMDILLRNSASSGSARGILVGELPEEALIGGNLTRLRLHPSCSPAWLLAWLLGPGGDRLYIGGKLQKQMLQQYRVPLPEDQRAFERRLLLYLELEDRAVQFVERAQALFESVLDLVFFSGPAAGGVPGDRTAGRLEHNLARLSVPMSLFLQEMSQFQQELYHLLLKSEDGQPVHTLLKQLRRGSGRRERADGIQDALSAFALLEQFGLVEQESPQKIPLRPSDEQPSSAEQQYVTDHNGRPVLIDTYKPTGDMFEGSAYAAGAGQSTEL